jgi:hypothetical protein
VIDIDRARELSDAREIERIHGGEDVEPKLWQVEVKFYLKAYDEDDALDRLKEEILPELAVDRSDPNRFEWEFTHWQQDVED